MNALDYLFVFQIAVFAVAVLGITWAVESVPALVRWLEYRRLRSELRRGRSISEIKAMRRAVRL